MMGRDERMGVGVLVVVVLQYVGAEPMNMMRE
jgi:hypothetical protein